MSDPAGSLRFNPSSAGALTLGVNMSVTFSENTNLNINQSIIQLMNKCKNLQSFQEYTT